MSNQYKPSSELLHMVSPSGPPLIDAELVVISGEVTQDKKISRCHLPRVVYHQVYNVYSEQLKGFKDTYPGGASRTGSAACLKVSWPGSVATSSARVATPSPRGGY